MCVCVGIADLLRRGNPSFLFQFLSPSDPESESLREFLAGISSGDDGGGDGDDDDGDDDDDDGDDTSTASALARSRSAVRLMARLGLDARRLSALPAALALAPRVALARCRAAAPAAGRFGPEEYRLIGTE